MRVSAARFEWGTCFVLAFDRGTPMYSIKDHTLAYAAEVIADDSGKFCGNGLTFPTLEAAEEYAIDLFGRWTLVRTWRVVAIVAKGWTMERIEVKRKGE